MAQILMMAKDYTSTDADHDRRGPKRGYPIAVVEDDHIWGTREGPPTFVIIKLPGVSAAKVEKYLVPEYTDEVDPDGSPMKRIYRRRLWRLRWNDLPQVAKNRLQDDGELVIGPTGDYTWAQVRGFFRNQKTGLDETRDL